MNNFAFNMTDIFKIRHSYNNGSGKTYINDVQQNMQNF